MSGYLARLVSRAAAPLAAPPTSGGLHPPTSADARSNDDPFETTVVDAPVWPPSPAGAEPAAPVPSTPEASPSNDAAASTTNRAADTPGIVAPREAPPMEVPRERPLATVSTNTAVPDMPNSERPHLPPRETAVNDAPTPGPAPREEPLERADRFMRAILPAALLPVAPSDESSPASSSPRLAIDTSPAIAPAPVAAIEPSIGRDVEPRVERPASGLHIGTVRVTVVPPPAASAAPAPQPSRPARIVVARPARESTGVPSFSRFG